MTPAGLHLIAALNNPPQRDEALLSGLGEEEWANVAQLAIRQRVGALLSSRPGLLLPPDVRATLQARAHRSAIRVLGQHAALRELADAVTPLGITLIALKGMHLATSVYRGAGLREMADVDVLVLPEHVAMVADTARALGYSSRTSSGDSLQHLPPFQKKGIAIELHFRLLSPAAFACPPTSALLMRSQPSRVAPNVVGLGHEDLIVHTCVHAAGNHLFELGLRPLCDLQAIVTAFPTQIDWTAVAVRAAEWRCQRSVVMMLLLARDYLGVPVPHDAFASAAGNVPSQDLLSAALATTVSGAGELAFKSPTAARLIQVNGPLNKARYVVTQLFLPSAEQAAASPDLRMSWWARSRHVVHRAIGVVRRHGGWLWRASRDRDGALRQALDRRTALAEWIRDR